MKEIDRQADSYLGQVKKLSSSEKHRKLDQITKLFSKSSEYGDDKVTLAMQTYEMVSYRPLPPSSLSLLELILCSMCKPYVI